MKTLSLKGTHNVKKPRIVIAVAVLISLIAGCSKKTDESKNQSQQQNAAPAGAANVTTVAGVHWTVPQGWEAQGERPMRAATYTVPSPKEGIKAGECGVFYFGNGQGGTVEDNLNRWISQFERGGKHEFSSRQVNGMKVTTITISGSYLSPAGPNMESQGKEDNYRLLGAIVEAPQGLVFFKFVGPAETVQTHQPDFDGLVNSIAKD
ncbi:MAG TPA: hypothetical protein VI758_05415 [Bacteroidota bacterium]